MTRNKYAALSFIPVTAARHDFGDSSQRRKRNLAFSFVFRTMRAAPRLSSEEAGVWLNRLHHGIAGVVTWCPPPQQSYPTYCCFCIFCHCSHVEPIFSCSLSNHFCAARSTFKALNIIHYNAVHSQLRLLVECGKCTICTSPPLSFSTLALPCLLLTRCHSTDQEPAFQKQRNVLLIEEMAVVVNLS